MPKYDKYYTMEKGNLVYPSVVLLTVSRPSIFVALGLSEGNLPLLAERNGALVELENKIKKCPVELSKLLRVSELVYLISETESITVKTIDDLLEADIDWTQ